MSVPKLIYIIYRKDVTLTHQCLLAFSHTPTSSLFDFFFFNQGATVKIFELSNKPQDPRTELRGMTPPFEVLSAMDISLAAL